VPQRVRLVLMAVVAMTFAGFAGAYLAAGRTPHRLTADRFRGYVRPPGARVPAYSLTDQDGRRVTGTQGVTIYAFIYSHCRDTCPLEVQQIRGALDDIGHDVPVVGVSVDPAHDTRQSARAFLTRQFMTGRMDFLLGTQAELAPVWRAFGIQPQTKGRAHSAGIVVVDGQGRQRIGFPESQLTPEALTSDLRRLGA
jgi:protein SCO1/2